MSSHLSQFERQRGQAMVFVLLFLGVVSLSLVFLYKAGMLTSQRMQVQNAADAVAYSVATVEARDLNFLAYTNRAMVANEVAIGQMVGLNSWLFNWQSYAYYLRAYHQLFIYPLVAALSLGTAQDSVKQVFDRATDLIFIVPINAIKPVLDTIINIGITVLHNINKAFGFAQTGLHYTTMLYAISVLEPGLSGGPSIIEQNAPGAHLSDFGALSLLMHTLTYASYPGAPSINLPVPGAPSEIFFTRTYLPTSKKDPDKIGYQRFAAVVNSSKDDFSKQRGWEIPLPIIPEGLIDFTGNDRFSLDIEIAELWMEVELVFELDLKRQGGSELRYVSLNPPPAGSSTKKCPQGYEPGKGGSTTSTSGGSGTGGGTTSEPYKGPAGCKPSTPGTGGTPPSVAGNKYNWSAADGTGLFVTFKFHFAAGADVFGETVASGSLDVALENGFASAGLKLDLGVLGEVEIPKGGVKLPFPTSAPFSSGSAQAAKTSNKLKQQHIALVNTNSYGGAPANRSAWLLGIPFIPSGTGPYIPPVVPVTTLTMPTTKHTVNKTYAGLPMYTDTTTDHIKLGFLAPYFMAGVVKENDLLFDTGPQFEGQFKLDEGAADGEIAAIAKASVYFKRPNDLPYFARQDGQEEFGSAFNPYWSARLVETTNLDRVISMGIQQKEFLVAFGLNDLVNVDPSSMNPLNWIP